MKFNKIQNNPSLGYVLCICRDCFSGLMTLWGKVPKGKWWLWVPMNLSLPGYIWTPQLLPIYKCRKVEGFAI